MATSCRQRDRLLRDALAVLPGSLRSSGSNLVADLEDGEPEWDRRIQAIRP